VGQGGLGTWPDKKEIPAMAAGIADHAWTLAEIAGLLD